MPGPNTTNCPGFVMWTTFSGAFSNSIANSPQISTASVVALFRLTNPFVIEPVSWVTPLHLDLLRPKRRLAEVSRHPALMDAPVKVAPREVRILRLVDLASQVVGRNKFITA